MGKLADHFLVLLLTGTFGVSVCVMRQNDSFAVFLNLARFFIFGSLCAYRDAIKLSGHAVLLDTECLIDGRISDLCLHGFHPRFVLIPRFVLA